MQVLELQASDYDDNPLNGINGAPAAVDPVFRKINKQWTIFLAWKIEHLSLVAVPKDQLGTFYDTESYLIYSCSAPCQTATGADTLPKEIKGALPEYHIHFWLGSETSPDKAGVAAFKAVELDEYLGGVTTQHRETEDYESSRFKSYFKKGIRILKSSNYDAPTKLFRVKGKYCPILKQLEETNWNYFTSSSVLILKTSNIVFIWIGRSSNAVEKSNAIEIAQEFLVQNKGEIVFVDDGYERTLSPALKSEFDKLLPLSKRHVLPDDLPENNEQNYSKIRLYRCTDTDGRYKVTEVKDGPLKQSYINSEGVFIIDQGSLNHVWIWVGKRASEKERSEALRNVRGFVKKKKYNGNTKVTRVVEGHEPQEFKMLFTSWKDNVEIKQRVVSGKKPTVLVSKYDAQAMEDRANLAAESQLLDNGSGALVMWRVENPEMREIIPERQHCFYSGDCYIVLYSYYTKREKYVLYYWVGERATQDDINCTILKTAEIEEELGGQLGFQARIIQGYEPPHFLQIFQGKMIIFHGKGSTYDPTGRNLKQPSQFLAKVFGSAKHDCKAIQLPIECRNLDSNYCFVLKKDKHVFIWCGSYSNGDSREMAKNFAGKEFELIVEGKEKTEFFQLIGGKSNYQTALIKMENDFKLARLFCFIKNRDSVIVEEILGFSQKNLIPEEIMLLDANDVLYVWVGKLSTKEEQRVGLKLALDYLEMDPAGRDMNIPVFHIKQGEEPPTFTGFFPFWDKKHFKHYKPFSRLRNEVEKKLVENGHEEIVRDLNKKDSSFDQYDKYPLEILLVPNDKLPARVDPLNKELYLTHDDFLSVFKMQYDEFEKLPKWKQQELKKKVRLF